MKIGHKNYLKTRIKRIFIYLLKVLFSTSIIWYLFIQIDFSVYLEQLKQANLNLFALAFLLNLSSLFLLTAKWKVLLRMQKLDIGYWNLYSLNLASLFYTILIPGGLLSGEAVKGYRLARNNKQKFKLLYSIFLDKYSGLLLILFLGFISYAIDGFSNKNITLIYIIVFLSVLLFYSFLVSKNLQGLLRRIFFSIKAMKKREKFFVGQNRLIASEINYSILIGMIAQVVITFSLMILFASLSLQINFFRLIWINSLVMIATMLPITFMGVGPREVLLVYLLGQFGFSTVESLSLATLFLLIAVIKALIGGVIELKRFIF